MSPRYILFISAAVFATDLITYPVIFSATNDLIGGVWEHILVPIEIFHFART